MQSIYHILLVCIITNIIDLMSNNNNNTERIIFNVNTDISGSLFMCRYFGATSITTLPRPTRSLPLSRLSMWGSTRKSAGDTALCAWSSWAVNLQVSLQWILSARYCRFVPKSCCCTHNMLILNIFSTHLLLFDFPLLQLHTVMIYNPTFSYTHKKVGYLCKNVIKVLCK